VGGLNIKAPKNVRSKHVGGLSSRKLLCYKKIEKSGKIDFQEINLQTIYNIFHVLSFAAHLIFLMHSLYAYKLKKIINLIVCEYFIGL
jgi:hypothetical protein